ncbi:hypothetical protein ABIB06_001409 [Bradyrhizobium sp. LB8.2]
MFSRVSNCVDFRFNNLRFFGGAPFTSSSTRMQRHYALRFFNVVGAHAEI